MTTTLDATTFEVLKTPITFEQQADALMAFMKAGPFLVDLSVGCLERVNMAREEMRVDLLGISEPEVPSDLDDVIERAVMESRWSYRMHVVSAALGAAIGNDSRYGAFVASNTKFKGEFKECSEPGAENLVLDAMYNYVSGLLLTAKPEDAESVEAIATPTVIPCSYTCVNETFPNSVVYPEDLLIVTSTPTGDYSQVFLQHQLRRAYQDGDEEFLNGNLVKGLNFEDALVLFQQRIQRGDHYQTPVSMIAQQCLLATADK